MSTLLINKLSKILTGLCLFLAGNAIHAQTIPSDAPTPGIDIEKGKKIIEDLNKKFTENYRLGDSLALADAYAADAEFGHLRGKDILAYWGEAIRNSIKSNYKDLQFTTTS